MSLTAYMTTLVLAFFCGFLLGLDFPFKTKSSVSRKKVQPKDEAISLINEQYRNFLNYDGTVQMGGNNGRKQY